MGNGPDEVLVTYSIFCSTVGLQNNDCLWGNVTDNELTRWCESQPCHLPAV